MERRSAHRDGADKVCIICDLILHEYGSVRPAILLGKKLVEDGWEVSVASVKISDKMKDYLLSLGIEPIDLDLIGDGDGYFSETWLKAWLQEAIFGINSFKSRTLKGTKILNFSQLIAIKSDIWYVQGPPSDALDDISSEFPRLTKLLYKAIRSFVNWLDSNLIRRIASLSKRVVANSNYCAKLYAKKGIKVSKVIYPPVDCSFFRPRTKEKEDYVLVYFGKETKFSVIRKLAAKGIKMKAFGGKPSFIFTRLGIKPRNIEYLGRVSDDELVDLYSRALFTLFAFTHEPFGYIPIESMACGTPVLTYAKQGPAECVVNGETGWLVRDDKQMIEKALEIWENGYPSDVKEKARKRALEFSTERIYSQWLPYLIA